jgi:hypothetical protein
VGFSSEDAVVVGAAILAAGWALTSFWGLLAGYLLVLTGAVLWVQLRTQPTALGAAVGQVSSVRVEDGALMVRSARWQTAVPLTRIAQGWTVEGRWGVRAFVDVREGDVFAVELATQREADALLDAAGVSLDRRVFTTRLAPPSQTGPVGCGVLIVASLSTVVGMALVATLVGGAVTLGTALALVGIALVGLVMVELTLPPTLTVGLDGVRVRSLLRRRFVPFSHVTSTVPTEGGVVLELGDGRRVELKAFRDPRGDEATVLLHSLVARALATSVLKQSAAAVAQGLGHRGERFADWLERISKLGGTAGYRVVDSGPEALVEVMEDARASPDQRLGAAILLAHREGKRGGERVRVVSDATADADLRAALEAVAEDALTEELAARVLRRKV